MFTCVQLAIIIVIVAIETGFLQVLKSPGFFFKYQVLESFQEKQAF